MGYFSVWIQINKLSGRRRKRSFLCGFPFNYEVQKEFVDSLFCLHNCLQKCFSLRGVIIKIIAAVHSIVVS